MLEKKRAADHSMPAPSPPNPSPALGRGEPTFPEIRFLSVAFLLRQNFPDHVPVHIGQPAVDAVVTVCQFLMIDPHEMENGGMEIVGGRRVFRGFPGPLVALAVGHASLDPCSAQPGDKGAAVVVTAGTALAEGHPPKLSRPYYERIFQQAAGLKVFE